MFRNVTVTLIYHSQKPIKSEVFDFAFIPKRYKRGTIVLKALC
jgi:hypothetical protein